MIKNNQFTLQTKFGAVGVKINGTNHFCIGSRLNKESGYGEDNLPPIVIRGKSFNYFNFHAALNPATGLVDIQTYDFDGNTPCFISKYPTNSYFKVKAVYCSEMTDKGKIALCDEVTEKLNAFYADPNNKMEINKIWAEIKQKNLLARINELESKVFELEKEIEATQNEIAELSKNVAN